MTLLSRPLDFDLPDSQVALAPAEVRGSDRDDVRLLVTSRSSGTVDHDTFARIDRHLRPGDVVVVNTSATVPAAIDARAADGEAFRIHFSGRGSSGFWNVELRSVGADGSTSPGPGLDPQTLLLPGKARLHLLARSPNTPRLWVADFDGTTDVEPYLREHGEPIRYAPGPSWPIGRHQTVFATQPGSAEMPSAGRPFTDRLVTRLISKGVSIVPVILHAGVSSYEEGESPGEERYEVPGPTATVINALRSSGGRVIAVGTTVVRALESVVDFGGTVHPGRGATDLVVTAETGARAVDGLLTGWHEPRSSHLRLLEALLPLPRLQEVYDEAIAHGYLWHEFGDELLILP